MKIARNKMQNFTYYAPQKDDKAESEYKFYQVYLTQYGPKKIGNNCR